MQRREAEALWVAGTAGAKVLGEEQANNGGVEGRSVSLGKMNSE